MERTQLGLFEAVISAKATLLLILVDFSILKYEYAIHMRISIA